MKNFRLKNFEDQLRPLNTSEDLVELGLFRSLKTAANIRCAGGGPDFLRIRGGGIRYPKEAVLKWLEKQSVYVEQEV